MKTILLALSILPSLIASYHCSARNLPNRDCDLSDTGSLGQYSGCMVRQYSFSAFIQCANQVNVADFTATGGDSSKSASPLEILLDALFQADAVADPIINPAVADCQLARNIQKAANEHGDRPFATYLCNQYHPLDAGLRCLQIGLMVRAPEHSIETFCKGISGRNKDLMDAPELQDASDDTSGDGLGGGGLGGGGLGGTAAASSSGLGGGGLGGGGLGVTAAASSSEASTPVETDTSSPDSTSSSAPSTVPQSAVPTTSPVTTPTSGTSTSPAVAATPTTGSASNERITPWTAFGVLGVAALLILSVF